MHDADDQGTQANVQPAAMLVEFSGSVNVPVRVGRPSGRVCVRVTVKIEAIFPRTEQNSATQREQHDRHAKLEPPAESIRDVEFQKKESASGHRKGKRVADAPEESDPTTAKQAFFAGYKSRDGDHMVAVRCVF